MTSRIFPRLEPVTQDPATGAMYVLASGKAVKRTVHVSDLVLVDLDADGEVVGVELAMDTRKWRT